MDNLNKKARLIDDWSWVLYEDGSGHIENSKGKQFCSFDYTTQEVKDLNNRWQFMNEYPYRTPWEMFKTDVENTLVSNGLASYNDTVKSIAKLEEKLNINKDFRLFNDNQFVGWKSYYDLPKVEKALSDMEAAMKKLQTVLIFQLQTDYAIRILKRRFAQCLQTAKKKY